MQSDDRLGAPGHAPPDGPASLVMCSGGIDSTHVLWQMLQRGAGRVHAHHVRLRFGGNSAGPGARETLEHAAFTRVARVLGATHARLQCSESLVHLPHPAERHGRAGILVFAAARVAQAQGFGARDRIVFGTNRDVDPGWCPDTAAFALRRLLMLRGLRAAMERDDLPRLGLADPPPAKAQMWSALPMALRAAVVSCSSPVFDEEPGSVSPGADATGAAPLPRPCGQCAKCRWRAARGAPAAGSGSVALLEQHVHRPGSAVVARGGAECDHLGPEAQPAVHLGLEDGHGVA
jgi:hypothetical protein